MRLCAQETPVTLVTLANKLNSASRVVSGTLNWAPIYRGSWRTRLHSIASRFLHIVMTDVFDFMLSFLIGEWRNLAGDHYLSTE